MNTLVNYELGKMLKEKGFDKPTHSFYVIDESEYGEIGEFIINPNDNYPALDDNNMFDTLASAPTISEVVMWLYEKHGVWICVDKNKESKFNAHISPKDKNYYVKGIVIDGAELNKIEWYDSPTEAYEAAIEYTLKNLIP